MTLTPLQAGILVAVMFVVWLGGTIASFLLDRNSDGWQGVVMLFTLVGFIMAMIFTLTLAGAA